MCASSEPDLTPIDADTVEAEYAALRMVMEGTAANTEGEFFQLLVQHMAAVMRVDCAMLAEFASPERVRTIALSMDGKLVPNIEYDLAGTPCEEVVQGHVCFHPQNVARLFPADIALTEMGIESYFGVPLVASDGSHLGHLCIFDRHPLPESVRHHSLFHIFAARATAELARLRVEQELAESERRYRDLYEEAPIAYVREDLESRFHSANRAAMRILGITPEQVPGMVGMSFIPDTPEAQRRVKEAFASVGRGTDTGGVVLELRRKDNGKPIWIQWWSKPEPGGQFTRTMFIDITERVLIEQEKQRLSAQNVYLQEEIKSVHNFEEIIGQSPAILAVIEKVNRVAGTNASVLITGETGTGKELIARAIHSASTRHDKPLIKLNCAALPPSLVESELFGHEKGAFSGAIERRVGRFELANGGTIFLDEVGEIPPDVQVKLLRVLQEREFERVGGTETIRVDVRVIAATNRDLPKAIREGKFREDLFYRLNIFPITLPPLRERIGDVRLLTQFLTSKFSARVGRRIESIATNSMDRLQAYPWPGNVRELENVLERAIILSYDSVLQIDPEMLAGAHRAATPPPHASAPLAPEVTQPAIVPQPSADANLDDVERMHILSVLEKTSGRIDGPNGAAKILGLHPNTLRSRMKKLGIRRPFS